VQAVRKLTGRSLAVPAVTVISSIRPLSKVVAAQVEHRALMHRLQQVEHTLATAVVTAARVEYTTYPQANMVAGVVQGATQAPVAGATTPRIRQRPAVVAVAVAVIAHPAVA